MQPVVGEDILVYYTLILWLSFAFQVSALKRVRFAWILRDFVAGSLCFSLHLFSFSRKDVCYWNCLYIPSHEKDSCCKETAIAELSI